MSRPQVWNIEQEKHREKEKVGIAKLNEKKGDRDLERETKNKGDIFLLEERHENFVTAVTKCVVPENIQTPTMEGIGNSRGVGGSETQEISEGRGVGQSNHFPGGQYHFVFDLSSNIASYRPGRSFLGHK